jgi:hypothetical protein
MNLESPIIVIKKKEVLIHNNYTCDITGIRGVKLVIHHLYSFSDILKKTLIELNLDIRDSVNKYTEEELKFIENKFIELHSSCLGICLQEHIHKEFHSIYGKGNNTKEQYIEFKNNKLNND